MGAANLLPAADIGDEDFDAHHVFQVGAGLRQGHLDTVQAVAHLGIGVARPDDLACIVRRGRAGGPDGVTDADRTRVADFSFPGGAGGDAQTVRHDRLLERGRPGMT